MDGPPPLTLSVLRLTPHTLIPTNDPPLPSSVPSEPEPQPPLPPNFSLSPTHNYPAPIGYTSLGSTLSVHLQLRNHKYEGAVHGVRMMCEVQGPGGRYRLGEVVHGQNPLKVGVEAEGKEEESPKGGEKGGGEEDVSELESGEYVELDVESEMKDAGLNVLIVSVAWETMEGRRTFQRFMKFNVTAPLSIKTRIQPPISPNILLNPIKREQVHLEILIQNTSADGLLFDRVQLEPVQGFSAESITGKDKVGTLMPGDTRQYLFVLSPVISETPTPGRSVFPPRFTPGTVLPLGRLDLAWVSGKYRDQGRLQTSTLNRRVPLSTIRPASSRMSNAISSSSTGVPRIISPKPPPANPGKDRNLNENDDLSGWEYDLAVLNIDEVFSVEVEKEFTVRCRVAMRSRRIIREGQEDPPEMPEIGIQYLTPVIINNIPLSPPSRASTPMSLPPNPRNLTSIPMTPVTSQQRQSAILSGPSLPVSGASFPPPTIFRQFQSHPGQMKGPVGASGTTGAGEIAHLGPSLVVLPSKPFEVREENSGTTYTPNEVASRHWEVDWEVVMRFWSLEEGLVGLGGVRMLEMGASAIAGVRDGGSWGEWDCLGEVMVWG